MVGTAQRWVARGAERRYLVAALLFLAVVLARLPFATTHLWAWDSVFYARALEVGFHVDADPNAARPHPPGYIWYVLAAQLLRAAVGDSNAAYVLLSIVASAAGAALLWLVASRWMRPQVALVLALAYAASPLVWTYSEIAYPYTLLALVSLVVGWLVVDGHHPVVSSLAFGLLSGARQDILLLLGPLWVWSIAGLGARRIAAAAAAAAFGIAAWWIPSAALSGGAQAYVAALLRQTDDVVTSYSVPANGMPALLYNLSFTAEAIGWALGLLLIPLALGVARAAVSAWRRRVILPGRLAVGLSLWVIPGTVVFTFVHIGEWGHVLSVVPPLFLAAGVLVDRARPRPRSRAWAVAAAAVVILPASAFLSGDAAYAAVAGPADFSAAALARHDAGMRERIRYVRRHFNAAGTVVLAREDYQLVRYYLPEYRAWYWDPDPHAKRPAKKKRAMRPVTVVVFTEGLQPRIPAETHRIEVSPGVTLATFPLEQGNVLELQGERYAVLEAPGR
jgi:hypothetical protein